MQWVRATCVSPKGHWFNLPGRGEAMGSKARALSPSGSESQDSCNFAVQDINRAPSAIKHWVKCQCARGYDHIEVIKGHK